MSTDENERSVIKRWIMFVEGIRTHSTKKFDNETHIAENKSEEDPFPAMLDDESDIVEKAKK
jgi:hypothetical protein